MTGRVLIVEPAGPRRQTLERLLSAHDLEAVDTPEEALDIVRSTNCDVLVVSEPDALRLIADVIASDPDRPVIVVADAPDAQFALRVVRAGGSQCVPMSRLSARLPGAVSRALETLSALNDAREATPSGRFERVFGEFVTRAPQMRPVMRALENAFDTDVCVLIHGESGTGKELAARAIHRRGGRADGPFVAVNCAGIPETLLEAELFGHERGAFTGAVARRRGVFEQAAAGTLFLDEIGELQPTLQAKLLRVLQTGEFKRLGGSEALTSTARVIAATNRDLETEVEQGHFRSDLYYRLAVYSVLLPPLRERALDVPYLVVYFLTRIAEDQGKDIEGADPEVIELLQLHDYPGNVRELENIIKFAVVSARDSVITVADLPPAFLRAVADVDRPVPDPPDTSELVPFETLAAVEKRHIAAALLEADGNKTRAARLLGISRMRLYRKIAEYDLDPDT